MRNYLSYGGGVNSTAMILLLAEEGWEFEAVYSDHGADWPETRNYVRWFSKTVYPITIIEPSITRRGVMLPTLYDYMWHYEMVPYLKNRHCTHLYKIKPLHKAMTARPCFELIGIDAGEAHRARLRCENGIESRYPLIEYDMDRQGCVDLIRANGIPVPPKSGCFFCPMQRRGQWKLLRNRHPDLFCKARKLEERNMEYRRRQGKAPLYLSMGGKPLDEIVQENQGALWPEMDYPPCRCEL